MATELKITIEIKTDSGQVFTFSETDARLMYEQLSKLFSPPPLPIYIPPFQPYYTPSPVWTCQTVGGTFPAPAI